MESGLAIAELTSAGCIWTAKVELQQQLDHWHSVDIPRHNRNYATPH
jgi:hypothetical protein